MEKEPKVGDLLEDCLKVHVRNSLEAVEAEQEREASPGQDHANRISKVLKSLFLHLLAL